MFSYFSPQAANTLTKQFKDKFLNSPSKMSSNPHEVMDEIIVDNVDNKTDEWQEFMRELDALMKMSAAPEGVIDDFQELLDTEIDFVYAFYAAVLQIQDLSDESSSDEYGEYDDE